MSKNGLLNSGTTIYFLLICKAHLFESPCSVKILYLLQLRQKILESHANVKDLNLVEAKMNFIRAWQSLPEYGVSLFVVR